MYEPTSRSLRRVWMPMAKRRHTLDSLTAPVSLSPGDDPAPSGVRCPVLRRVSLALTAVDRRLVSFSESVLRGSDGTCGCTPSRCWPVTKGRRAGPVSIQRVDPSGDDVADGYVPGVVYAARQRGEPSASARLTRRVPKGLVSVPTEQHLTSHSSFPTQWVGLRSLCTPPVSGTPHTIAVRRWAHGRALHCVGLWANGQSGTPRSATQRETVFPAAADERAAIGLDSGRLARSPYIAPIAHAIASAAIAQRIRSGRRTRTTWSARGHCRRATQHRRPGDSPHLSLQRTARLARRLVAGVSSD